LINILLLIILILFSIVMTFRNHELSDTNKEFENSLDEKNIVIAEYEDLLLKYEDLISKNEEKNAENEVLVSKYEDGIEELQIQVDALNEEYDENRNKLSIAQYMHLALLNSKHAEFEMLLYNNEIIRMNMDENEFKEQFGEPIGEKVSVDDGTVVAHQEGVYWKTSEYENFIVSYLGDREGKNYKIHSFFTESSNVTTIRDVKVGDSLEKLLQVHPMLEKYEYPDNTVRYQFPDGEYLINMEFEVRDNLIVEILYLGYH